MKERDPRLLICTLLYSRVDSHPHTFDCNSCLCLRDLNCIPSLIAFLNEVSHLFLPKKSFLYYCGSLQGYPYIPPPFPVLHVCLINEPESCSYSLLTIGVGIGFVTGLLPVVISQFFGRKRTAPTGISYAGAGFGAFIFPLLFQYFLDSFGLREACLMMGGLTFLAIFGALFLHSPDESTTRFSLSKNACEKMSFSLSKPEKNCYDHQEVIRESTLDYSCHPTSDASFSVSQACSQVCSQEDDETAKLDEKSLLALGCDDDASMIFGDERINDDEERTSRTGYTDCSSSSSSRKTSLECHQGLNCKERNSRKSIQSDREAGNETDSSRRTREEDAAKSKGGIIVQVLHEGKCYSSPDSTTFLERDDSSEFPLLNERFSRENRVEEEASKGIPVAVLTDEEKVTEKKAMHSHPSKKIHEQQRQDSRITETSQENYGKTWSQWHGITDKNKSSKDEDRGETSNLDRVTLEERNRRKEDSLEDNGNLVDRIWRQILTDSHILTKADFFLITFTYMAYIMGNVTLLMILPDYVVGLAFSKEYAVMLLSLFSVTDLTGRLLAGWLPFFFGTQISNKSMYVFSIAIMGVSFFLFPLILSPTSTMTTTMTTTTTTTDAAASFLSTKMRSSCKETILICLTLLCGFVSGCQMILPPVVIADTMGPENTAVAFGLSNFFVGLVSFSRPFIFREYCALLIARVTVLSTLFSTVLSDSHTYSRGQSHILTTCRYFSFSLCASCLLFRKRRCPFLSETPNSFLPFLLFATSFVCSNSHVSLTGSMMGSLKGEARTDASKYNSIFFLFGSFALLSSLAWVLESLLSCQRKRRHKKEDTKIPLQV